MIEVLDNYCDEEYFKKLKSMMVQPCPSFPWFYHNAVNGKGYDEDQEAYQFVHTFYPNISSQVSNGNVSELAIVPDPLMDIINPIVDSMGPLTLLRAKANCTPRTEKIIEHGLHVDFSEKRNDLLTTAIFYMNTNNGYTYFEDGTRVKSVENRLIVFPCNLLHGGTTCTDQNIRVVINFNFMKKH